MSKTRQSNLELLKIISMIMIVSGHISAHPLSLLGSFSVDLQFINPIQRIILVYFYHFPKIANFCFFICTSWFLIDSNNVKIKRIFYILLDTSFVGIFMSLTGKLFLSYEFKIGEIIGTFVPTIWGFNWYIATYIMIYMIHPYLNLIIESTNKEGHKRMVAILFTMYFGLGFLNQSILYTSNLLIFITVYFLIAYIKKYKFLFSKKKSIIIMIAMEICFVLLILFLTLFAEFDIAKTILIKLDVQNNALFLLMAFCLFSIFNSLKIESKLINKISSYSLLVYAIHDGFIAKKYRILLWDFFINALKISNYVHSCILITFSVFSLSLIVAFIYKNVISNRWYFFAKKIVNKLSDIASKMIENIS